MNDKQISINETSSKTVKGMANNGSELLIVFTDGTYILFNSQSGYDGDDSTIEESELDLTGFGDAELIFLGVTTQEELNAIRSTKIAELDERLAARDKAEFERLKLKFEGAL